jgi:hypothetical protein
MADRFYNISADEMTEFLEKRGFQKITLPKTYEMVFAKVIRFGSHTLSLRVYTAITEGLDHSRAKGEDAIRVSLYCKLDNVRNANYPVMCGKPQKCLRVSTWETNVAAAIARCEDVENFRVCSQCGSPMTERQRGSDGQKFWGCSAWKFTKCRGRAHKLSPTQSTRRIASPPPESGKKTARKVRRPLQTDRTTDSVTPTVATVTPNSGFRIPSHLISEAQKRVEQLFTDTVDNIMMGARAGSGKTTMLKHLAAFCDAGQKIVYLTFNRKNAVEGSKKLPRWVDSSTTHRFCGAWLRAHFEIPRQQDGRKNLRIMEEVYPLLDRNNKARRRVRKASFRLTNLAKHFACKPDDKDAIKTVMDQYTFDLEGEGEVLTVQENVQEVLQKSLPQTTGGEFGMAYNYDDMLWWPIVLDLEPPKVDVLLADEVQDFNACQIEMVRRIEAAGGRVVAVGDPYQAVYRFRGADNQAYSKLEAMLKSGKRTCQEVILPTNYRCGKAHIEYVRQHTIVKDIEAAPTALEGTIGYVDYNGLLDMLATDLLGV